MFQQLFPYYQTPTAKELKKIFEHGTIAIDANIVLNFYRYSDSTREDFLKLYESRQIRARLWLPHHAAREFMRNRPSVKAKKHQEINNIAEALKGIRQVALDSFEAATKNVGSGSEEEHPHINIKNLRNDLQTLFDELIKRHLNSENSQNQEAEDTILDRLNKLFYKRVGQSFDELKLEEIRKRVRSGLKTRYRPVMKIRIKS